MRKKFFMDFIGGKIMVKKFFTGNVASRFIGTNVVARPWRACLSLRGIAVAISKFYRTLVQVFKVCSRRLSVAVESWIKNPRLHSWGWGPQLKLGRILFLVFLISIVSYLPDWSGQAGFLVPCLHAEDAEIKLNSNDGSTCFVIQDSNALTVSSITSVGNAYFKGNVGIGTTGPGAKLHIVETDTTQSYIMVLSSANGSGYNVVVTTSGNVGIGTTAPSATLDVAGRIEVADGSASAPTYAFGSDTDTGMFLTSPNVLAFAVNGFIGAYLTTSMFRPGLVVRGMDGTSGSPAYSFVDDPDVGMFRPSINTLALSTNGSERLRIDNSGNVGIGTTSPQTKFQVDGGSIAVTNMPTLAVAGTALYYDAAGILGATGSSKRYKKDIKDLGAKTKDIMGLRAVRFKWKKTGEEDIGLIAEEVDEVIKDLVIYDKKGRPNGVKYDKVAIYLLQVVKAQQHEIDTMKTQLKELTR